MCGSSCISRPRGYLGSDQQPGTTLVLKVVLYLGPHKPKWHISLSSAMVISKPELQQGAMSGYVVLL